MAFIVFIAFIAGISAAAIGPGGIFLLIILYLLTPFSTLQIAATTSGTFIVGGLIGTAVYIRSGDMDLKIATIMGVASLVGTRIGTELNTVFSKYLFGLFLGLLIIGIGIFTFYQEARGLEPVYHLNTEKQRGYGVLLGIGLNIGIFGGLLGIGGPVLAVPLLVLVGVPMLVAVAIAQFHMIFVTISTTVNYFLMDAIVYPLILMTTIAYGAGTVVGWKAAHEVEPRQLKLILSGVLFISGVYLLV